MTIKECIDIVDNLKPNQYSLKEKVMWLSFIDEIIINDVLKTHEGYDGKYDDFAGYSEDKLSVQLIVASPYDRLYTAYLKMKIDGENGETARYNNSASLFNSYLMEYRKFYNKTHMPLDVTVKKPMPKPSNSASISDAQFENLKRELYYLLSKDFAQMTSQDKLYDIVTNYALNNIEMLKGKDGVDGRDGKDGVDGKDGINGRNGTKGDKGEPFTYEDFTAEQLATLKGEKGDKGDSYVLNDTDMQTIVSAVADSEQVKFALNEKVDSSLANVTNPKWQHLTTVTFEEEAQQYLSDKFPETEGVVGVFAKVYVPKAVKTVSFSLRLLNRSQAEALRIAPPYVSETADVYGQVVLQLDKGLWDGWWTDATNSNGNVWTGKNSLRFMDAGKTDNDLPYIYRFCLGAPNGSTLPIGTKMEMWVLKNG